MLKTIPSIGEIVYHKDYGKGEIVYLDSLYFYGVKFESSERCIHDSELYNVPIDKYGNPITKEIEDLHKQRTMLAVINDNLLLKYAPNQSHKDWFIEEGWISHSEDPIFKNIIRGYFDDSGIYFYKGEDFYTDEDMELFVKRHVITLKKLINKEGLNIYCGLIKGKPGEKFKPLKHICTI